MQLKALTLVVALAGFGAAYAQPAPAPAAGGHDPAQVAAAAAMHKTCAADQAKLCPTAASPHEQLACMKKIMDQLSPDCAKAITAMPPGRTPPAQP